MNLKDISARKNIVMAAAVLTALTLIAVAFGVYWVQYLKVAHSTFENYYAFRGCVQLVERTDVYGVCRISSGQTITIVKYDNRWFLDGDLPWSAPEQNIATSSGVSASVAPTSPAAIR
jgi:hypothetical protein